MLTLDTLYLFKAYRINKSRAHSPEEIPDIFFLKQNKSSTLLLYYLTVIIIKSLLLLVPFVRFQSLCQCYKTSSSTEHICKEKKCLTSWRVSSNIYGSAFCSSWFEFLSFPFRFVREVQGWVGRRRTVHHLAAPGLGPIVILKYI